MKLERLNGNRYAFQGFSEGKVQKGFKKHGKLYGSILCMMKKAFKDGEGKYVRKKSFSNYLERIKKNASNPLSIETREKKIYEDLIQKKVPPHKIRKKPAKVYLKSLPTETIEHIVEHLDLKGLTNLRGVSKDFKNLADLLKWYFPQSLLVKKAWQEHIDLNGIDEPGDKKALEEYWENFYGCLAFEKVMKIFGGPKAYEALPVFEHESRIALEYSGGILPRAFKAPICRGIDIDGRRFFVIRFKLNQQPEKMMHQVFYERHSKGGSWESSSGGILVDVPEDPLSKKRPVLEKHWTMLAEIIRNGGIKHDSIFKAIIA